MCNEYCVYIVRFKPLALDSDIDQNKHILISLKPPGHYVEFEFEVCEV